MNRLACVVFIACASQWGIAQEPESSLWLSTKLTIGMPREQAEAELSRHYKLRPFPSESTPDGKEGFIVFEKEAPPWTSVGFVTFENGKLKSAQKDWSPDNQQHPVEFTRGFYGAVSSMLGGATGKVCFVHTRQQQTPTAEARSVSILCGSKSVDVSVLRVKDTPEAASLSESLGEPSLDVQIKRFFEEAKFTEIHLQKRREYEQKQKH